MTKELFVSSTPHETKVGLVEDDQLAEIYLERENEYTLAGSIYKGRVTRVLPGMQSAFVDIGLERDAFLYVSDFMELEDPDEVEEVSDGNGRQAQPYQPQQRAEGAPASAEPVEPGNAIEAQPLADGAQAPAEGRGPDEQREGGRGYRGRRRRRGGKRGERMPESRFAKTAEDGPQEGQRTEGDRPERTDYPARAERPPRNERNDRGERPRFERTERPERSDRSQRSDFGPPPGYQPMVLPGESISKYRRAAQSQPPVALAAAADTMATHDANLAESFPEDEPMFDGTIAGRERGPRGRAEVETAPTVAPYRLTPEQERLEQMNVAAVFGGPADEVPGSVSDETAEISYIPPVAAAPAVAEPARAMEEEEIEEDEADLAHFVEELAEEDAFEEMEEETHAAGDHHDDHHDHDVHHEDVTDEVPVAGALPGESIAAASEEGMHNLEGVAPLPAEEGAEEEDEEDAELEEAQAEAEAMLEAESRVEGTVDASAEVRAPSPTAPFTQRQPRPGRDRERRGGGGGQRGRRGGRRFPRREPQNVPLISDLLKEGQEVLVQIAKEPIGKKGARITSHIALPGRFLVYMPTVNHTGVSRKIASEEERQRLKRIILSERENGHGGFIVRTAAQNASEEELRADIRFLKGLWTEIRSRADAGKSPALIYHDLNVVERVLRDQVTADFSVIWVDSEQEYERILRFANRFQPALVKRVKLYSKETPLYDQFGLNEELNKALKSKVWLKSGGYIVINQTEALVAIDINTGKYVGKTARLEDTIVKTNVDAIKEIVRQIRLRDLGGIIVIDFIDMDERRNRQKVMQALEEALRSDRAPSKALQFNDFGLVAITRKRVKQSLERTIGSPCPYCQSTGYVKSVTTVCNEIYVEMRKLAKHLDHSDVMLRVNPEVAKALKIAGGRWLNELEELTKKTVIVKSDPALHQEQFDIN